MKVGRNLLAGVVNSAWSALLGFIAVHFYLKYLGIEAYGLIGFFLTTQALLQILDMGLAPTINREVARASASGKVQNSGKLLHTLATVYWGTALVIALFVVAAAPWMAQNWIQSKQLPVQTVTHAVGLMGLVVASRWPVGLYQGVLIGAQRLTVLSGISMAMTTAGSAGAVAVLAFVAPTIEAFFIWQTFVGLLHVILIRAAAWKVIGKTKTTRFDFKELRTVWRFTAHMSAIGLTALILTQLDKLILSKTLSLEEFGHYMLAMVVVTALNVFINPLFNVIYPRFSALVISGDTDRLINLYHLGTRLLATVLFPAAMALAIAAEDLVRVWTGETAIASSVAPIMALMACGSALHGTMYFPYSLQLAYGKPKLALATNIVLVVLMAPLIIIFSLRYGAVGGAAAWFILHLTYLFLGTWVTNRHLLKGVAAPWLLQDVGIPLVLSVMAGLVGYHMLSAGNYSLTIKSLSLIILCAGVMTISLLTLPKKLKSVAFDYINNKSERV